mmetsp:Transcript_13858/g.28495  ORF Transcript_13858/g.28495 Transcript_13858/m.28495 type:complete len:210 (-) Transcript_13858:1058-1687(-)
MTSHPSRPSAALISVLFMDLDITVGSQRDSLVSVRRKIASDASMSSCSLSTSFSAAETSFSPERGWPGMGMVSTTPSASTSSPAIFCSASAAATALYFPPPSQSSSVNRLCLAGFEYDTRPLSTNVIRRTPHPCSVRATPQPSVPAPRRSTRIVESRSRSRAGRSRHFMRRRLRSVAWVASRAGLRRWERSTDRGPGLRRALSSQPVQR